MECWSNLSGGDRESKNEARRSIRRWKGREVRERHAELYSRFSVVALHSPIEDVGTGHHQTVARVCGDIDAPRLCVFVSVFVPLALVVVRLGVPGCSSQVRGVGEIVVLPPRRKEGPINSDWVAVVEKRVVLAFKLTSLLRTGPHRQHLAFLGQIQGSKV